MKIKYFKTLINKMENYNKKAINPFVHNDFQYNPFKSIYEQTYIWVTKERG